MCWSGIAIVETQNTLLDSLLVCLAHVKWLACGPIHLDRARNMRRKILTPPSICAVFTSTLMGDIMIPVEGDSTSSSTKRYPHMIYDPMPLSFPGDSTLLPSQVFVSSLRTETRRSCLGGLRGAAGSETSRYDFCHDQKAKSHVTKWHPSSTGYHPPPFWRKSHPVGPSGSCLLRVEWPNLTKYNQLIQLILSRTPRVQPSLDDWRGLIRDALPSTSLSAPLPSKELWDPWKPAGPLRLLRRAHRAASIISSVQESGTEHFSFSQRGPNDWPTRIDLDYLLRSPVAIRKGASSSA